MASPRPTVFVRNAGQAPGDVAWQAVGAGFEAAFSADGFTLTLVKSPAEEVAPPLLRLTPAKGAAPAMIDQRISFVNANPRAVIEALDPQPGKVSFFRGRDTRKWASGLTTYASAVRQSLPWYRFAVLR
jgi:hypothetical protein